LSESDTAVDVNPTKHKSPSTHHNTVNLQLNHTPSSHQPSYSTYFTPDGRPTTFLSSIHIPAQNARSEWRNNNVKRAVAKHNRTFAPTPAKRREWRTHHEIAHLNTEVSRLKKWRLEGQEKEHKETAAHLKKEKKRADDQKSSWERVQRLEESRVRIERGIRERERMRAKRGAAGLGRDFEDGEYGAGGFEGGHGSRRKRAKNGESQTRTAPRSIASRSGYTMANGMLR
jgi:hypothetical protein